MINFIYIILQWFVPAELTLVFLTLALTIFYNFSGIRVQWPPVTSGAWFKLGLIVLVFFIFTTFFLPHFHSMWSDEAYYGSAATSLLKYGAHAQCVFTDMTHYDCLPTKPSHSWSFLISIIYLLFGINNIYPIYATLVITTMNIFLVFTVAGLVFKKEGVALWTALFFSLQPIHITWATHAETNMPGLFFVLTALIFWILYFQNRDNAFQIIAFCSYLFSVQMRLENIFLLPLIVLLYGFELKEKKKLLKPAFILTVMIFVICIITSLLPQIVHLTSNVGVNAPHMYNFSSLMVNLKREVPLFFGKYFSPLILFGAILGLGLGMMEGRYRTYSFLFLVWFLVFFFFWPSRVVDSAQPRYFIIIFWIVCMYAAYFQHFILEVFARIKHAPTRIFARMGMSLVVLLSAITTATHNIEFPSRMPDYKYKQLSSWIPSRLQKDFQDKNALVITNREDALLLQSGTDLKIMFADRFLQKTSDERQRLLTSGDVYYYEGMIVKWPLRTQKNLGDCYRMRVLYDLVLAGDYLYQDIAYKMYKLAEKEKK